MQDTTFRKNYDSEFCGNVPLNFINSIQPYGFLLVLHPSTLEIVQLSENIEEIIGSPFSTFLNKSISEFIPQKEMEGIKEKLFREGRKQSISISFTWQNTPCFAIVHFQERQILLEVEKTPSTLSDFSSLYQEIRYVVAMMKETSTLEEVVKTACKEIKRLSGFDKVMIYQFNKDWNGLVVAEEAEPDMDLYLGLWFPASDIPKQARELYLKNPFRWIPDSSYVPVKFQPLLNPISFTFTDLSPCNLRGVPSVHLEYLKNMKVGTSMSTPIIKNDQLWGLITCHNKAPRTLHYDVRCAIELLSNIISAQISSKQKEKSLILSTQLETVQTKLFKQMIAAPSFEEGLLSPSGFLLQLLDITGAAILYKDDIKTTGNVPPISQLKEIAFWLKINNVDKVYATENIEPALDLKAQYKDIASGMIAIPISLRKGDYILGFRPEVVQTVEWGGNPNNAINFEEDKKTYHPRHSFTIWKETVSHSSNSWQEATLKAAEDLQKSILEITLNQQN